MNESPQWAVNIIHTCVAVQPGEKVLGTIHVAIGRNDFLGGANTATTHIDGVVGGPMLEIDGQMLIDNGQYLLKA